MQRRRIKYSVFTVYILNFFTAQLPRHFVLKPASKSIYVPQGQSGEVTCEAEGPSVSTLKWEKQQDDKSYAAVPNSQVNVTKDANYVRATLKITNAQFTDNGTYKCTVSVPPNKSNYKETDITVMGRLLLYSIVRLLLIAWICFRSPRDQFLVKACKYPSDSLLPVGVFNPVTLLISNYLTGDTEFKSLPTLVNIPNWLSPGSWRF